MSRVSIQVGPEDVGARLDRFLAQRLDDLSRSRAHQLIEAGDVQIGGAVVTRAATPLHDGQRVEVRMHSRPPAGTEVPQDLPLAMLYEDQEIAVLDKAAGMVVHPGAGHESRTLVNALLFHFGDRLAGFSDASRPGIVHRLDKGTSGVMVVAFTDTAHARLQRQFANRTVAKEYLAMTYGHPPGTAGTIDVALGRDRNDRRRVSSNTAHGRDAQTDWESIEKFPDLSWLWARPRTGRTHQIRAHLTHLGHPLVGDDLYSGRRWKGVQDPMLRRAIAAMDRPALHAATLELDHPSTGERLRYEAPLPPDLERFLAVARDARDRNTGRA